MKYVIRVKEFLFIFTIIILCIIIIILVLKVKMERKEVRKLLLPVSVSGQKVTF